MIGSYATKHANDGGHYRQAGKGGAHDTKLKMIGAYARKQQMMAPMQQSWKR